MDHYYIQIIREFSTTTLHRCVFLILFLSQQNCTMKDQYFEVHGDTNLLKAVTINIYSITEDNHSSVKSLLYNGVVGKIKAVTEIACVYTLFISNQDSLVNTLKFENVMRNAKDPVNQIYLSEENDEIFISYVGRESDIEERKGFKTRLIPLDLYFEQNNITKESDKTEMKEKFFDKF